MPRAQRVQHPGWIITDWMQRTKVSQVALVQRLGISVKHLYQIRKGQALWSASLAAKIEQVTAIPASQLLTMKFEYNLDQVRQREEHA